MKWRQAPDQQLAWGRRYATTDRQVMVASGYLESMNLGRSVAALYGRREVARMLGCRAGDVNPYGDPGDSWQLHDELFFRRGYDVPLPYFMENRNRAAWLGVAEEELPEY